MERSICDYSGRFLSQRNQNGIPQFFENLRGVFRKRIVAENPHVVVWIKPLLSLMIEETSIGVVGMVPIVGTD